MFTSEMRPPAPKLNISPLLLRYDTWHYLPRVVLARGAPDAAHGSIADPCHAPTLIRLLIERKVPIIKVLWAFWLDSVLRNSSQNGSETLGSRPKNTYRGPVWRYGAWISCTRGRCSDRRYKLRESKSSNSRGSAWRALFESFFLFFSGTLGFGPV